jgi:hypothetical protein
MQYTVPIFSVFFSISIHSCLKIPEYELQDHGRRISNKLCDSIIGPVIKRVRQANFELLYNYAVDHSAIRLLKYSKHNEERSFPF